MARWQEGKSIGGEPGDEKKKKKKKDGFDDCLAIQKAIGTGPMSEAEAKEIAEKIKKDRYIRTVKRSDGVHIYLDGEKKPKEPKEKKAKKPRPPKEPKEPKEIKKKPYEVPKPPADAGPGWEYERYDAKKTESNATKNDLEYQGYQTLVIPEDRMDGSVPYTAYHIYKRKPEIKKKGRDIADPARYSARMVPASETGTTRMTEVIDLETGEKTRLFDWFGIKKGIESVIWQKKKEELERERPGERIRPMDVDEALKKKPVVSKFEMMPDDTFREKPRSNEYERGDMVHIIGTSEVGEVDDIDTYTDLDDARNPVREQTVKIGNEWYKWYEVQPIKEKEKADARISEINRQSMEKEQERRHREYVIKSAEEEERKQEEHTRKLRAELAENKRLREMADEGERVASEILEKISVPSQPVVTTQDTVAEIKEAEEEMVKAFIPGPDARKIAAEGGTLQWVAGSTVKELVEETGMLITDAYTAIHRARDALGLIHEPKVQFYATGVEYTKEGYHKKVIQRGDLIAVDGGTDPSTGRPHFEIERVTSFSRGRQKINGHDQGEIMPVEWIDGAATVQDQDGKVSGMDTYRLTHRIEDQSVPISMRELREKPPATAPLEIPNKPPAIDAPDQVGTEATTEEIGRIRGESQDQKSARWQKWVTLSKKGIFPDAAYQVEGMDVTRKAKMLKAELQKEFPGIKFSVKSSRYSMGQSINVHFDDGPSQKEVENIVEKYSFTYGEGMDYTHNDNFAFASKGESKEKIAEMKGFIDQNFDFDGYADTGFLAAVTLRGIDDRKAWDKAEIMEIMRRSGGPITVSYKTVELIPGGMAEGKPDSNFDPIELTKGVEVEMEHTPDPERAKEIAKDHLVESPRYYEELEKMEKGIENEVIRSGDVIQWEAPDGSIRKGKVVDFSPVEGTKGENVRYIVNMAGVHSAGDGVKVYSADGVKLIASHADEPDAGWDAWLKGADPVAAEGMKNWTEDMRGTYQTMFREVFGEMAGLDENTQDMLKTVEKAAVQEWQRSQDKGKAELAANQTFYKIKANYLFYEGLDVPKTIRNVMDGAGIDYVTYDMNNAYAIFSHYMQKGVDSGTAVHETLEAVKDWIKERPELKRDSDAVKIKKTEKTEPAGTLKNSEIIRRPRLIERDGSIYIVYDMIGHDEPSVARYYSYLMKKSQIIKGWENLQPEYSNTYHRWELYDPDTKNHLQTNTDGTRPFNENPKNIFEKWMIEKPVPKKPRKIKRGYRAEEPVFKAGYWSTKTVEFRSQEEADEWFKAQGGEVKDKRPAKKAKRPESFEEKKDAILIFISANSANSRKGVSWQEIEKESKRLGMTSEELEEATDKLIDAGEITEPTLGWLKIVEE